MQRSLDDDVGVSVIIKSVVRWWYVGPKARGGTCVQGREDAGECSQGREGDHQGGRRKEVMEGDDTIQTKMGSKQKLAALVKDQKEGRREGEEGAHDTASASGTHAGQKKHSTGMGVFINCGGMFDRNRCPCPYPLEKRFFPKYEGHIYIYILSCPNTAWASLCESES